MNDDPHDVQARLFEPFGELTQREFAIVLATVDFTLAHSRDTTTPIIRCLRRVADLAARYDAPATVAALADLDAVLAEGLHEDVPATD